MFRSGWKLSSALRTQVRNVMNTKVEGSLYVPSRHSSSERGFGGDLTKGEQMLLKKLMTEFPNATHLEVSDVSGGCGAMYQISIETPEFIGKRKLQQQQMVNKILAEEIKEMHGLQLNTQAPDVEK